MKLIPTPIQSAVSVGLLSIVASSTSIAAEQDDTVIVTATRTAQTANDTVSSVKVITRDDIEQSQLDSLPSLMSGLAGMHIAQNGGRGQNASIFMRGTNSDHVIVLIDGVKVGSATTGSTAFEDLPLDMIDRIEIVRGPRSSLYGAEALGGVIQIFTRKGDNTYATVKGSIGSHDTYRRSASIGGRDGGFAYGLVFAAEETGGIDACRKEAATEFGGCYTDQPDSDGYENLATNINVSYEAENGSKVAFTGIQSDSETEFDGNSQNSSESTQRVLGLKADLVLGDKLITGLSISRSEDKSDNFKDRAFASAFNTKRDSVSLQNELMLDKGLMLVFGLDYQNDKIDTDGDNNFDSVIDQADQYDRTSRENWGGFLQALLENGAHSVELSARNDENQQFGSHVTGGVGYGYKVSNDLRIVASYGTAFAAPTFNQLYYPDFGKSDLEPEESRTYELGFRSNVQGRSLAVTYFNSTIKKLIGYDSSFNQANIDKATVSGIEIELDQRFAEVWQLGLDFSVVDAKNKSVGANNGNMLARRPNRSGRIALDYLATNWSSGASVKFAGTRFDDQANTKHLKAYNVVDLKTQYSFENGVNLQAKVENVFNERYETAKYYNQVMRAYTFTAKYDF